MKVRPNDTSLKKKSVEKKSSENEELSIDVISLLDAADFVPDEVVSAAAINPSLYVKSIRYRLKCMQNKVRAEIDLKRISAEKELDIRNEAKENDEKITEGHIKAQLILDTKVREANLKFEETEVFDEFSKLVVRIFEMRRDCMEIVSRMNREELRYSGATDSAVGGYSQSVDNLRKKSKERFPETED